MRDFYSGIVIINIIISVFWSSSISCGDSANQSGIYACDIDDDCIDDYYCSDGLCYKDDKHCGNNVIDSRHGEECDGSKLNGKSCVLLGYSGGDLSCGLECNYDITKCSVCGNNIIEEGEICDGVVSYLSTCIDEGFDSGVLLCDYSCNGYDTSGCHMIISDAAIYYNSTWKDLHIWFVRPDQRAYGIYHNKYGYIEKNLAPNWDIDNIFVRVPGYYYDSVYICGTTFDSHLECWEASDPEYESSPVDYPVNKVSGEYILFRDGRVRIIGYSHEYICDGPFTDISYPYALLNNGNNYMTSLSNCDYSDGDALPQHAVAISGSCVLQDDQYIHCFNEQIFFPPKIKFRQFVNTGDFSCGIRSDNSELLCWGGNNYGQLNAPNGKFKKVVADGSAACAIKIDDTLWCWGDVPNSLSDYGVYIQ